MIRVRAGALLLPLLALFVASPAFSAESDVVKISAKSSPAETVESLKKLIADLAQEAAQ